MTFIIQIAISLAIGFLSAPRMQALIISIRIIIIEIRVIRTRRGVVIIRLHRLLLGIAVPAATAITADIVIILISIGVAVVIITLEILTGWNSCPALVVIICVIVIIVIVIVIT